MHVVKYRGAIMGKLNVVISEDIDTKFRQEVFKRKGMKKGNLTEALEEAMTLWIKSDFIENIKRKALSKGVTTADMKLLVDALKTQGKDSLSALGEIANKEGLKTTELAYVTEAVHQISSKPTSQPTLKLTPFPPHPRRVEPSSPV